MNDIIVVDIGNTSTKVSLCDINKECFLEQLIIYNKDVNKNNKKLNNFFKKNIDKKIVVGSVSNKSLEKFLITLVSCNKKYKSNLLILEQKMFGSLKNEFKCKDEEIGIDILSLSYYISRKSKSGIGICLGTAVFAVIVNDSKIKGVLIAPSFNRSFNLLTSSASMINEFKIKKTSKKFGMNTDEAISSGYYHVINGFINSSIKSAKKLYKIKDVFITGGNSVYEESIEKNRFIKYHYNEKQLISLGYLLFYKENIANKN